MTEQQQQSRRGNDGKGTVVDAPRANVYNMLPEDVKIVGLDAPYTRNELGDSVEKHHLYDERAFRPRKPIKVARAKAHGIPFVVHAEKDGEHVLIAAGRQRVLDAREANKQLRAEGHGDDAMIRVKVSFERKSEADMNGLMLAENALREDDDPFEEATKIGRYLERLGGAASPDAIAAVALNAGCSTRTVQNKLRLLQADVEVIRAVRSGRVTVTSIAPLLNLSKVEQKVKLVELEREAGGKKVKADAVKRAAGRKVISAPPKKQIRQLSEAEGIPSPVRAILKWALGEITNEEAIRRVPGFSRAMKG